jgi:hypothetical protein
MIVAALAPCDAVTAQQIPIFAPHVTQDGAAAAKAVSPVPHGPTSNMVRARIVEKLEAKTAIIPQAELQKAGVAVQTVVMAPYIVDAKPVTVVMPLPVNRLAEAVKTGRLFSFGPGDVKMIGTGDREGFGRIRIGFSFSW